MIKADMIRARIDPNLKARGIKILKKLGLTPSQYINLAFQQLDNNNGIPFDLHIPNDETLKAMEEAEKGENLTHYDNIDDFFKKMGVQMYKQSTTTGFEKDFK